MADVIVVGGSNMDIKAKSLSVNHFGTSNPARVSSSPGGVGRNIAHNLARLGVNVGLISIVGADLHGEAVLDATAKAGVDISRVSRAGIATGTYIAVLNPDGELVTAMNDMRAVEAISPEMIASHSAAITAARMVVADCNLPLATLAALAAIARDKLFVEPVSVPKSAKLALMLASGPLFMASPNLDQVESMTGSRDIAEGLQKLHQLGIRNIVAHAGSEGAFVSDGTLIDHVEAKADGDIIDVTGAGDAAVAGVVFGLLQGKSLTEAAAMGQTLAGRVIASTQSTLE